MLRQLPQTITADETPDWLPVGWIVHSKPLKRGRQTKTYTQLRTRKTFSTKDQVLEYNRMEKLLEKREYLTEREKGHLKAVHDRKATVERPPWLPDHWRVELRIGSICGNAYNMYVNTTTGYKTNLKRNVLSYENNMKSLVSSGEEDETECNEIAYVIEEDEEDFSESKYAEDKVSWEDVENISNQRSQPKRIKKLESRAKTQCIFIDEDMSSDSESDNKLSEAETSKEENALRKAFQEKNLHNVVVECEDKAREIPGLSGTLTVEINLDCEPARDSLVRKDWNKSGIKGIETRNIEIIDLESDSSDMSDSSKGVEVNQESGGKSEEPLKAHAAQEETADELGRSAFFPHREAPSNSVLAFDTSNARSSAEDLSNTMELGLDLQEKSSSESKKQKKNTKECSSKNIKMKGTEAPTKTLQKDKRPPSKSQGKKRNSSVVMQKKTEDWPDPCPYFPFEPITRYDEDDSVIRRYLEQYYRDQGSEDSNIPLPDFGLPSFSNIRIAANEEPESKRMESPGPPCVQDASSSLPSCSSIGSAMKQTVAGN